MFIVLFSTSQSRMKKPKMSKERCVLYPRRRALHANVDQDAGGAPLPPSPARSLLNRTFSLAECLSIHFGFKCSFFTATVLCVCRLATLSIMSLFKQISLSQGEGSEEYPIIVGFFFGEGKEILRSLSKCTIQIILIHIYCFAFPIKF